MTRAHVGLARFRVLVREDGKVREFRRVWSADGSAVFRAYRRRYPHAYVNVWED